MSQSSLKRQLATYGVIANGSPLDNQQSITQASIPDGKIFPLVREENNKLPYGVSVVPPPANNNGKGGRRRKSNKRKSSKSKSSKSKKSKSKTYKRKSNRSVKRR